MPSCVAEGCARIVRPGKFKGPPVPGTEGMCRRCAKKQVSGVGAPRRKVKATSAPSASNGSLEVHDLSVAALLEEHRLVEIVGVDLLRAIASRLTGGAV